MNISTRIIKDLAIKEEATSINPTDFSAQEKSKQLRVKDTLYAIEKEAHKQYVELGKIYRAKAPKPASTSTPPKSTPTPTPSPLPTPTPTPTTGDKAVFDNMYTPPNQLTAWAEANKGHRIYQKLLTRILPYPMGIWVSRDWPTDIEGILKAANGKSTFWVMYNAIKRDIGQYSAGGANTFEEYMKDLKEFLEKLTKYPGKKVVALEPDALPHIVGMGGNDRLERVKMLREGLKLMQSYKDVTVYLDAGHSNWHSADQIATLVKEIGHYKLALNISNRRGDEELIRYAEAINKIIPETRFIIDRSRNAIPQSDWCNPAPEGVGLPPTSNTGNSIIDAFVWAKVIGESDGTCNGGPNAGEIWPARIEMLTDNAK